MTFHLSNRVVRVALGVIALELAAGLFLFVWLLQRDSIPDLVLGGDQGQPPLSGPMTLDVVPGPGKDRTAAGLADKDVNEGAMNAAPISGSSDEPAAGSSTADTTGLKRSSELQTDDVQNGVGELPGLGAVDSATVADVAELDVRRNSLKPDSGGLGDVAKLRDCADLVVRDSRGKIKSQLIVK